MISGKNFLDAKTDGKSNFKAFIDCYIPDFPKCLDRSAVIVCPGGAYSFLAPHEGECIALRYATKGICAFVLNYSVAPAVYPQAMCEAAKAVSLVRENAEKWRIDKNKVCIAGFSAGGHLAASTALLYKKAAEILGGDPSSYRPNAMILSYPVITFGKKTHKPSFENLLGANYSDKNSANFSLDTLVTKSAPPAFIWHTFEDKTVPVENSLRLAAALASKGVSTELHIFPHGDHGVALADEVSCTNENCRSEDVSGWMEMSVKWIKNL